MGLTQELSVTVDLRNLILQLDSNELIELIEACNDEIASWPDTHKLLAHFAAETVESFFDGMSADDFSQHQKDSLIKDLQYILDELTGNPHND